MNRKSLEICSLFIFILRKWCYVLGAVRCTNIKLNLTSLRSTTNAFNYFSVFFKVISYEFSSQLGCSRLQ